MSHAPASAINLRWFMYMPRPLWRVVDHRSAEPATLTWTLVACITHPVISCTILCVTLALPPVPSTIVPQVLDLSAAAAATSDLRPSRLAVMTDAARAFIRKFFELNPLGHLGIVVLRQGIAQRLTDLSGSPEAQVARLQQYGKTGRCVCVGGCLGCMWCLCVCVCMCAAGSEQRCLWVRHICRGSTLAGRTALGTVSVVLLMREECFCCVAVQGKKGRSLLFGLC